MGLLPPEVAASAQKLAGQGKTVMLVAVEDEPRGLLAVADQEKPGAAESLSELRGLGLKTVMLTGDN